MPAIGRSSRRAFLAFAAVALRAAEDPPTLALLTKLAARLSDGNFPGALDAFSKTMPGYEDLARNLDALTSQYDIICTIEILDESGDDAHRKAETEWFVSTEIEVTGRPDSAPEHDSPDHDGTLWLQMAYRLYAAAVSTCASTDSIAGGRYFSDIC